MASRLEYLRGNVPVVCRPTGAERGGERGRSVIVERGPRGRRSPSARVVRLLARQVAGAVVDPDEQVESDATTDEIEIAIRIDVGRNNGNEREPGVSRRKHQAGADARGCRADGRRHADARRAAIPRRVRPRQQRKHGCSKRDARQLQKHDPYDDNRGRWDERRA